VKGRLTGHLADVYIVAFSPDGTRLASGSADATVRLWDVANSSFVQLDGHKRGVRGVAWASDGKLVVSASEDKTVSYLVFYQ
jgi:WD40 repeat protein